MEADHHLSFIAAVLFASSNNLIFSRNNGFAIGFSAAGGGQVQAETLLTYVIYVCTALKKLVKPLKFCFRIQTNIRNSSNNLELRLSDFSSKDFLFELFLKKKYFTNREFSFFLSANYVPYRRFYPFTFFSREPCSSTSSMAGHPELLSTENLSASLCVFVQVSTS